MVTLRGFGLLALCVVIGWCSVNGSPGDTDYGLKVLTVALEESDGCRRFVRSAKVFNLDVQVLGPADDSYPPDAIAGKEYGGYRMHILRQTLQKYKNEEDLIVLYADRCEDSLLTTGGAEIVEKFKKLDARIVVSAGEAGTPDSRFAIPEAGYSYVSSSGMIIGYVSELLKMFFADLGKEMEDSQAYLTYIYLGHRVIFDIKLDWQAEVFQNLNKKDVELHFNGSDVRLTNIRFKTRACIVHSNEQNTVYMNHVSNYLPKGWTHQDGCLSCNEDMLVLGGRESWPTILIGVFVTALTPFMDSFFLHVSNFDYPKSKISLFVYNSEHFHIGETEDWVRKFKGQYKSVRHEGPASFLSETQARNIALMESKKLKVDYYFSIDGMVTLTNRNTLRLLIEQNRPLLAPAISKYNSYWSNFWGDVTKHGYYERSPDFTEIVAKKRQGVWNVPYINHVYLMSSKTVEKLGPSPFYSEDEEDLDVEFCKSNRANGLFMYVTNTEYFGHLKEFKTFTTKQKHNDMYEIITNKLDWEDKYLHPEYKYYLPHDSPMKEPCHDVFWAPMFTPNFTRALIEECEHFGNWSDGGNVDKRISGGYENVPTVDIHMNQIGFENHWLYMLKEYFAPMVLRVFAGYHSKSSSFMNFVVKYTPTGQYFLRPHHDESTYTVNLALNERGVDYEGGGARFIRYNCSVPDTKVGWALLHPGRLTHLHEGLETTNGTRYIMVSFVDP